MSLRYRTSASVTDSHAAAVPGGLSVRIGNPLKPGAVDDASATNPEQLLALAWASCLQATASVLTDAPVSVRVDVELRDAEGRAGYEFHPTAVLSAEGLTLAATEDLAQAAHARCPVSRLLHAAPTVAVRAELFACAR